MAPINSHLPKYIHPVFSEQEDDLSAHMSGMTLETHASKPLPVQVILSLQWSRRDLIISWQQLLNSKGVDPELYQSVWPLLDYSLAITGDWLAEAYQVIHALEHYTPPFWNQKSYNWACEEHLEFTKELKLFITALKTWKNQGHTLEELCKPCFLTNQI